MSTAAIDRCVASGAWIRIFPATYVIAGIAGGWKQRVKAATMSVEGSVASHRSAAVLWDCPGFTPGIVELTVSRRAIRAGVKVHETKKLDSREIRRRHGIPVTDPERTLIDLGCVASEELTEAALDHFLSKKLSTLARINSRLCDLNGSGWRGTGVVRELVEMRDPRDGHAESRLETRLCRVLRKAKLSLPKRQVVISNDEGQFVARVDLAYPDRRLVIEAQGYEFHSSRQQWSKDIDRRRALTLLGWRVIEVTWHDVTVDLDRLVSDWRTMLGINSFAI